LSGESEGRQYRGPLRSGQRASGAARRLLYCCRLAGL